MPRDQKIPGGRRPELARRADTGRLKKPARIRMKAPVGEAFRAASATMREHRLTTVGKAAGCSPITLDGRLCIEQFALR